MMKWMLLLCVLVMGASCESDRFKEEKVRVLVPDPMILVSSEPYEGEVEQSSPNEVSLPLPNNVVASRSPNKTGVSGKKKEAPSTTKEEDELLIRETLKSEWKDILVMAQERTLSRQDLNYYVPLAQGIENYISYGKVSEASRRVREVKESVLNVELQSTHIHDKVSMIRLKLQRSELPEDQIKEFSETLLRVDSLLREDKRSLANSTMNELLEDLRESEKVNQALDSGKAEKVEEVPSTPEIGANREAEVPVADAPEDQKKTMDKEVTDTQE